MENKNVLEKNTGGKNASVVAKRNDFVNQIKLKIKRIVAALYLVTNAISDSDPVKVEIRQLGVLSLKTINELSDNQPTLGDIQTDSILMSIDDVQALLEIAVVSGLVSSMNCSILTSELQALAVALQAMKRGEVGNQSAVLNPVFFGRPLLAVRDDGTLNIPRALRAPQIHTADTPRSPVAKGQYFSDISSVTLTDTRVGTHGSRREVIIGLLSKMGVLGIKDIAGVIQGCSEKTIQRELTALVLDGTIKRQGERRWSRYSLVQGLVVNAPKDATVS